MAENKPYAHRGDIMMVIPTGSVACSSGDYVVMARNIDPISRAVLGAESRIRPAASAYASQWGIGIVDSDFTTNTVGATLYATPTANQALPVIRRGVVRLAINKTSGKAGDLVIYVSGATGAQLFTLNNFRRDVAVGRLYKDFTGATANDLQQVELIEKPISEKDIYFWLGNGVVQGCKVKAHSVANQASTQVMAGATGEVNLFMVKGKMNTAARKTDFTLGIAAPGASDLRMFWFALKVSTTGAAIAFTKETCTGPFTAFASWTASGVSLGMMIPITWTSNMIPVGLGLRFSATLVTMKDERIFNLGPAGLIPWGAKVVDHTKWYL
jgi:hypothetical protein